MLLRSMTAITLFFLFTVHSFASTKSPLKINIDSPKFRKLISAVPSFRLEDKSDKSLDYLARHSAKEFERLAYFTGYFQMMNENAYQDILKAPMGRDAVALPGFESVDLLQWKGIGVESLTIGKLAKQKDGRLRLELRTADIHRGLLVLGKAYILKNPSEMDRVLKQYIDRLLVAYTGKPGIFASKLIFIGRKNKSSQKQLYQCDIDGKHLKQLSTNPALHLSPAWNSDGTKVLYTSYESGNPDLYQLDLKTNKVEKIAGYKGINSGGVFSANNKLIAYSGSIRGNTEIYLKDSTGKNRIPLIRGHGIDVDPAFSPDGKWLTFVSGRYGNPHVFRAELSWNSDMSQVRVTSDKRLTYAGWYNATPAWSPDSEKIAFAGFDRDISRFDIFVMNHDGTKMERLTMHTGDNESPSWSPNGQLIAYNSNRIGHSDRKGRSQLYIMNRDGSSQRLINTGLYEAETPKWGPYIPPD